MAKKKQKRARTGPAPKKVDLAAGWGVWLVLFVLLYAPAWFWASRNAFSDQQSGLFPWIGAFVLAAIGAGLGSWLANLVLQWWSRRANRLAAKKQ